MKRQILFTLIAAAAVGITLVVGLHLAGERMIELNNHVEGER